MKKLVQGVNYPLLPKGGGLPEPPSFWRIIFFGMDLREMLSGISSQMMDTCYGENRMKTSRPTLRKNNS